MQNGWIWLVVAIVILGGGFWWWQSTQPVMEQTPSTTNNGGSTPAPTTTDNNGTPSASLFATITYDAGGFSPASVTIKKGGTVTWNNETTGEMWVASAQHPNHTVYSGTSRAAHCPDTSNTAFDQCSGGNNYTFKFDKVGTWNYHDHLDSSEFGTVIVVE